MAGEKKGKRKGLGGLSPEKKRMLKQLIMQKAAEDMKKKQEEESAAKKKIIDKRVAALDIQGMGKEQLEKKVKELHDLMRKLEEEKYDWEVKIRNQDFEINELNIKVNDIKGKFVKPMLKKVSKTESKLAKFDKAALKGKLGGIRDTLKSTGQSKFAIEEEGAAGSKKPEWSQESLSKAKKEEGEEEEEAGEEEEEEEEEEE